MFKSENIYSVLKNAEMFLESRGLFGTKRDVEILLSSVLKIESSKLPLIRSEKLTDIQKSRYEHYILRRSKREPIAYITGSSSFMYFEFKVNRDVFIPRPETEILVESVLKFLKRKNKCSLLDLCTGSGCIAVSLEKLGKFRDIMASDINPNALIIAKKNAQINSALNIDFVESDIFNKIGGKIFDTIVANPPYVSCEEYGLLEPELKYEPQNALMAKDSGLFFYKKIATEVDKHLKENGVIFIELNANKAESIKLIFLSNGYKNIEIIKDYAGLPRILRAEKER
ncbi:MAG: peptide chain release factor N(5)-glutamine methyltransferase [Endomicrobium sp.]|jgi:release factor glutamine methyltransferase|nr:peptide chain release factor N(5)-glutamine methyltransferase [Endomicrobium sp.]